MARQDPWDSVPVVERAPRQDTGAANVTLSDGRKLVRRPDGSMYEVASSSYTNETPTQLLNQGYEPDENGVYAKTIGSQEIPWSNVPEAQPLPPLQSGNVEAFSQGATEQIPFLDEAAAFAAAKLGGYDYADVRALQGDLSQYDRQNYGAARNAGGVSGFAAGLAAPGGAGGSVIKATGLGAGYGALYGLGAGEGSLADRAPGGAIGAAGGAVGGAAIQGVTNLAARRLTGIAGVGRAPLRGSDQDRAAIRVANAINDTGGAVSERQRLTDLGLSPSIMDIGGGTNERLVRTAAGPAGPGADAAVDNLIARQASLKPDVIRDVRGLTPVTESADDLAASLTARRRNLAREEYAAPYSQTVAVPDDVRAILSDEPGRAAIRAARANAVELRDAQQVAELDRLMNADLTAGPLPEVSAGTLDRIVQATRERATRFSDRGLNARAAGAIGRRETLDAALDNVEGLADARATYRGLSEQIDALDPRKALDIFEDPRDFARRLEGLSPQAREAALVRVTQDITDVLGGQRAAGTGTIDTAAQAPYARQNLEALLGAERAGQFIDTIAARVQQTQRAARVSPNTNSQTFGRMQDDATFQTAERLGAGLDVVQGVRGNPMAIARTIDRLRARATMSPAEREEVVRLGLGSADELERILMIADQARSQGRRLPREVRRFVEQVETRLGAPTADALLGVLQPSRSLAEQERQQQ